MLGEHALSAQVSARARPAARLPARLVTGGADGKIGFIRIWLRLESLAGPWVGVNPPLRAPWPVLPQSARRPCRPRAPDTGAPARRREAGVRLPGESLLGRRPAADWSLP